MKFVVICGPPASGKSSLLRRVRRGTSSTGKFKFGLLRGVYDGTSFYYLGVFDGSAFEGTDRLSMAVQRDAELFVAYLQGKMRDEVTVVFEGDRLCNMKYLSVLAHHTLRVFMLDVSPEELGKRHLARADTQKETWLKGRATKLLNIRREFNRFITPLQNDTEEQAAANSEVIREVIYGRERRTATA